jgi:hypothetical protein
MISEGSGNSGGLREIQFTAKGPEGYSSVFQFVFAMIQWAKVSKKVLKWSGICLGFQ